MQSNKKQVFEKCRHSFSAIKKIMKKQNCYPITCLEKHATIWLVKKKAL